MTRLRRLGRARGPRVGDALAADFDYEGIATCAGDSMCQAACPVKIDTGALVKELKAAAHPAGSRARRGGRGASTSRSSRPARGPGLRVAAAVRALPLGARARRARVARPRTPSLPTLVPAIAPRARAAARPRRALPTAARRRGAAAASSTSRAASPASSARCPARTSSRRRGRWTTSCAGPASRCALPGRRRRPLLRHGVREQGLPEAAARAAARRRPRRCGAPRAAGGSRS